MGGATGVDPRIQRPRVPHDQLAGRPDAQAGADENSVAVLSNHLQMKMLKVNILSLLSVFGIPASTDKNVVIFHDLKIRVTDTKSGYYVLSSCRTSDNDKKSTQVCFDENSGAVFSNHLPMKMLAFFRI